MNYIIDVHAHAMPLGYAECLIRHGVNLPMLLPISSNTFARTLAPSGNSDGELKCRLNLMDSASVRYQLLSPTFAPYFADRTVAIETARSINDELAQMVSRKPDRLRAYASLPLPHVDAALMEINYALDVLKLVGVTLQCSCDGLSFADARFDPIFAELSKRNATLFLHPAINGLCSHLINDWKLTSAAGPLFEDAVAVMHIIVAAIPQRFPGIKIVVPHLGGGLATSIARLDNQLPLFTDLRENPSVTVRRLWYDTCCHGSAAAMISAIEVFGADRLLAGSDYPFLTLHEDYADTFDFIQNIGLTKEVAERILSGNATTLFPDLS
ncbi:amidohydrolase family protein [Sphingobium boeckii]|uniref:Aminocarboxymuconate-semialdehyde decarboxylase n=1 Tax=Sphingobium boeckii TaxID=1082345 RepID=A0A7W9EEM8_9SPHN|nr:amidohydrolase family protein [Sphingobium boeckii]MBB5684831.1 aminocarboxymuconate-semialdehyde decarboxylase [Sphingobium boeckii]